MNRKYTPNPNADTLSRTPKTTPTIISVICELCSITTTVGGTDASIGVWRSPDPDEEVPIDATEGGVGVGVGTTTRIEGAVADALAVALAVDVLVSVVEEACWFG